MKLKKFTVFILLFTVIATIVFALQKFFSPTTEFAAVLGDSTSAQYYVSPSGNDANQGSIDLPWKTMDHAIKNLKTGDTLFVREGVYETVEDAWRFRASGTEENPITVTNYPGEQAVFKINSTRMERRAFRCQYDPNNPSPRQSSPANHIHLVGTDISSARTLSNGVTSQKGLVVLGIAGANAVGIESIGAYCNNWEVTGFDFIETGGGIFQRSGPSQNWNVHRNRVYNFYRESGMQFNGHNNNIYDNEIYLVNSLDRTYGCQMINILGHNNHIRDNTLSRAESKHKCIGILFEWDLADHNIVENNTIEDVPIGITFEGGDHNIIRNNTITATSGSSDGIGVNIKSYDGVTGWPCNETSASFSNLLPPNDLNHPEYAYFYNPRNCHSMYNHITSNKIIGFSMQHKVFVPESTNTFSSTLVVTTTPTQAPTIAINPTKTMSPTITINPITVTPTTANQELGDLNNDSMINLSDVFLLRTAYGEPATVLPGADLNSDGRINAIDYVRMLDIIAHIK